MTTKMNIIEAKTIYIVGASDEELDKIRNGTYCWASGEENLCLTFEDACEVAELRLLLRGRKGGDVIVSK